MIKSLSLSTKRTSLKVISFHSVSSNFSILIFCPVETVYCFPPVFITANIFFELINTGLFISFYCSRVNNLCKI
jgi:hypothetical protein